MNDNKKIKTFHFDSLPIEIEVKDLSFIKELPKLLGTPHKVSFYQLVWISEGEAYFKIDFQEINIKKDHLLVITPGQVCEFDTKSDYQGKIILFTNTFFTITDIDSNFLYTSQILTLINKNTTVPICTILISNLINLLEQELKQLADPFQGGISQNLLRIILHQAERKLSSTSLSNYTNSVARQFYNAVEQNFTTNRQVKFYADLLSVSEKVLARELKSFTDKTPKSYIEDRIVLEAKRLLSYSNLSIKEIGFNLGFDEPSNFNKFFKVHTQITPVDFRESKKNNNGSYLPSLVLF